MDSKETRVAIGVAAVLALVVWLISFDGHLKVKATAEAAMDSGDEGFTGPGTLNTGITPAKWKPHIPANAHMGRHKMYRHPSSCSPNLTAPHQVAYDWLYSPPAQGDL